MKEFVRETVAANIKQLAWILFLVGVTLVCSAGLMKLADTSKEEQYVGALIGGLSGGVIAYLIARWQLYTDRREEHRRNKLLLKMIMKQVAIEVRDNGQKLKKLAKIVESKDPLEAITWSYAHAITEGFRTDSYGLLLGSGLIPEAATDDIEVLYNCYSGLEGAIALVRELHAQTGYNLWSSEKKEVQRLGKDVITNNATVISQFESKQTKAFLKRHLP